MCIVEKQQQRKTEEEEIYSILDRVSTFQRFQPTLRTQSKNIF